MLKISIYHIQPDQTVFILADTQLFEGYVTNLLYDNKVEVMSDCFAHPFIATYGIHFFLTREKAEKVLERKISLEANKKKCAKCKGEKTSLNPYCLNCLCVRCHTNPNLGSLSDYCHECRRANHNTYHSKFESYNY